MELEWHLQVTSLTGRLLPPDGYEGQVPYAAMLQVELLGGGYAYMHAAMSRKARPLTRRDIAKVAQKLRIEWSVTHVLMLRGDGAMETHETADYIKGGKTAP